MNTKEFKKAACLARMNGCRLEVKRSSEVLPDILNRTLSKTEEFHVVIVNPKAEQKPMPGYRELIDRLIQLTPSSLQEGFYKDYMDAIYSMMEPEGQMEAALYLAQRMLLSQQATCSQKLALLLSPKNTTANPTHVLSAKAESEQLLDQLLQMQKALAKTEKGKR